MQSRHHGRRSGSPVGDSGSSGAPARPERPDQDPSGWYSGWYSSRSPG